MLRTERGEVAVLTSAVLTRLLTSDVIAADQVRPRPLYDFSIWEVITTQSPQCQSSPNLVSLRSQRQAVFGRHINHGRRCSEQSISTLQFHRSLCYSLSSTRRLIDWHALLHHPMFHDLVFYMLWHDDIGLQEVIRVFDAKASNTKQ